MTFSRIGFKKITLEPVEKFVRDYNSEITVWMSIAQEYRVVSSA